MALPEVVVRPGKDSDVFDARIFSDLEALPRQRVAYLMDLVRFEALAMMAHAPRPLLDALGPKVEIPLYKHAGTDQATTIHDIPILRTIHNTATGEIRPLGYMKAGFRGMSVRADQSESEQELRRYVGHETLHLLSSYALYQYRSPVWEACVARLEKEYYGPRPPFSSGMPWNPGRLLPSTGFRAPELGDINYGPAAREAMYIAAYSVLDRVTAQQVWQMWTILTAKQQESGIMPSWNQIDDALLVAAGSEGSAALREPSFRPMQAGKQMMLFQTAKGGRAYSFDTVLRAEYGILPNNTVQPVAYDCVNCLSAECRAGLADSAGGNMGTLDFQCNPMQDLDFAMVEQTLRRSGQQGAQMAARLASAELRLPPPFTGSLFVKKPS